MYGGLAGTDGVGWRLMLDISVKVPDGVMAARLGELIMSSLMLVA
jgi:hypothetical protein